MESSVRCHLLSMVINYRIPESSSWKVTLILRPNLLLNFYLAFGTGDQSKLTLNTKNVLIECTATDLHKVR